MGLCQCTGPIDFGCVALLQSSVPLVALSATIALSNATKTMPLATTGDVPSPPVCAGLACQMPTSWLCPDPFVSRRYACTTSEKPMKSHVLLEASLQTAGVEKSAPGRSSSCSSFPTPGSA